MPYRTLAEAPLSPAPVDRPYRTIPRAAQVLTLAAQVLLWGGLVVDAWTILLYFQQAAADYAITLSRPLEMVLEAAVQVRRFTPAVVVVLLVALLAEVRWFVIRRPLTISKRGWLALVALTLVLPLAALILSGLLLLQPYAQLLHSLA